jgi:hypothetical protein
MKVIKKCSDNIPENSLVKYDASGVLIPYDGSGEVIGVSNKCKDMEIADGVVVHVCELIIKDIALCVLSSSFSKNGGIAYADNGRIKSTGSYEVGYVFPKPFTEEVDYQESDEAWIKLK